MYLAGYIERLGTGTGDNIRLCKEKGLKEPEFIQEENFKSIIWRTLKTTEEVADHVTNHVTGQATGQATGQVEESIRRVAFRNRLLNPQSIPKPADEEIKKTISGEATIHEPIHEPIHVTAHVTDHVEDHVKRLLLVVKDEISRQVIMERLELKNRSNFMQKYLKPALDAEYIEMTIPDKPRSVNQKYRLTPKGIATTGK